MASPNRDSSFQSWLLTPQEILQGSMFTDLQEYVMRNQLAMLAEEKLALPWLPENVQRESELKGSITQLQHMLEMSASAKQTAYQVPQPTPTGVF